MNIFEERSDLPFSRKSDREKEKSTVSFTHVQNTICSQTLKPNTVGQHCAWAHHYLQAVICRSRGGLSANEKEETFASNDNNFYWRSLRCLETVFGHGDHTDVFQSPLKWFYPCPISTTFSPVIDYELKFVKMQFLVKSISLWEQ